MNEQEQKWTTPVEYLKDVKSLLEKGLEQFMQDYHNNERRMLQTIHETTACLWKVKKELSEVDKAINLIEKIEDREKQHQEWLLYRETPEGKAEHECCLKVAARLKNQESQDKEGAC